MRASTGGLCLSLIVGCASAASAANDSQLWITNAGTVKFSDTRVVSEEVVTRFSENRKGLYEFEVNSLVGYHMNDVVTVWAAILMTLNTLPANSPTWNGVRASR